MNAMLRGRLLTCVCCAGLTASVSLGAPLAPHPGWTSLPDGQQCPGGASTPTVVIGTCDSGVPNATLPDGCTVADQIAACDAPGINHGQFVSCVARVTNKLKRARIISGAEKGRITSCAAQPTPSGCRVEGATCDDGSICTTGDRCHGGACVSGSSVECDDLDICTVDSCDPASGCANAYVGDGNACDMWVTNGPVDATALHGDILYISGGFNWVSPRAVGAFVPLDAETAELSKQFPEVAGSVVAAAPDGAGGWFIAGTFYRVGDVERAGLAHILADGTVADWDPCAAPNECDQYPFSDGAGDLVVQDGVVYVTIRAVVLPEGGLRLGVAAIDARSGQFTDWNPDLYALSTGGDPVFGGDPTVLVIDGDTLFAGARFTSAAVTSLWAIDTETAEVIGRKETEGPGGSFGPINDLALRDGTLYAGGAFATIDGQARSGLAAIDVASWVVTPWNPDVLGGVDYDYRRVSELAVSGGTLFVGGTFDSIGGQPRNDLAAIDTDTGQVTGWDPGLSDEVTFAVKALAVEAGRVYAAGDSFGSSGLEQTLAAIDAVTGAVLDWASALHQTTNLGAVDTIVAEPDTVWVGGRGFTFGGVERNGLAAIDVRTGRPTDWPNADCFPPGHWGALDLAATDDAVYLVGAYVFNDLRPFELGVFALDPSSLSANCVHWTHSFDSSSNPRTIAVGGDVVYIGGNNVIGRAAVALDAEDGTITPWDPGLGGQGTKFVWDIEVAGQTVYLGGRFTSAHGEPRNHLAAVDAVTGLPTPWDPNPSTPATSLAGFGLEVDGGLAYVVGSFSTIGGQPRNDLAAVDAVTGLASPWNPEVELNTLDFSISDGIVYLGYRAVDTVTGAVASWDPFAERNPLRNPEFYPDLLEAGGGVVFIGSAQSLYYGVVGGELRSGIAAVAGVSGLDAEAPPVKPDVNVTGESARDDRAEKKELPSVIPAEKP